MDQNYKEVEEILENPGILVFKLSNPNKVFPEKKRTNKYEINEVNVIKDNIIKVFQDISENIEKFKNQNPEYLGHIIKNLNSKYNNKSNKFIFPGLQVINMDREKLNFFTHYSDRFLLCEKSDGVRYLLIQYRNGICHLVARNLEFFEIYISEKLPPSLYGGDWNIDYLLDGELILDDVNEEFDDRSKFIQFKGKHKKINFLIFDAVVIKGINYGHLPFYKRLDIFSKVFKDEYEANKYIKNCAKSFVNKVKEELSSMRSMNNKSIDFPNPGKLEKNIKVIVPGTTTTSNANNKSITLYMKDYYNFNDVGKLNELIKLLPHHNDGLIINVDDYPYYSGQSCEIFKWKPIEMNTIDFEIKYNKNKDRFLLCVVINEGDGINKSSLLPVEILCFESDEEKNKFKNIYNQNENKLIAECFYDANLFNDEVAINNYYLSKIKNQKNDRLSMKLEDFPDEIDFKIDQKNLKGGWRFQRLRNDKSSGNYINTYQNIKICIKENLHIEEVLFTVEKNKSIMNDKNNKEIKKYIDDYNSENKFMSALVWKRFFKANVIEKDDLYDEDFFHLRKKDDNDKNKKEEKEFLNKKRQKPDSTRQENEKEKEVNNDDNSKDDYDDDDDLDKLCDDDYGDDLY